MQVTLNYMLSIYKCNLINGQARLYTEFVRFLLGVSAL